MLNTVNSVLKTLYHCKMMDLEIRWSKSNMAKKIFQHLTNIKCLANISTRLQCGFVNHLIRIQDLLLGCLLLLYAHSIRVSDGSAFASSIPSDQVFDTRLQTCPAASRRAVALTKLAN